MDTNSKFQHIEMTAEIIAASGPQRPADRVLKERLRNMPPSQSRLKRDISESVFAWFKWRRWPEALNPDHYGILQALSLHRRFQSHPDAFDAELLRQRVIPAWIDEHLRTNNAWIQTLQQNPCIWLRARPGTRASLGQELGGVGTVASGILEDSMEFCGEEDLFRTNAFHRGCFEIQDVCSQAVGLICGPRAGESWWDVCAGEGGKMLHLSDMMVNKGLIWATDPARWRLQKLKRRAARAGVFNYRAVHWQATGVLPTKNRFDGVLVDAPCSGIGTWQRNPHARWTTTAKDVGELASIQIRLLKMGAKSLKPGGRLIYSVCTLTNEETEVVADALLEQMEGLETLKIVNPFEPAQPPVSRLWLWPQQTRGNGMFIAAWRRKE